MDSSKAKQAKSKAKARTKQKAADSAQQAAQMGALQQQQAAGQGLTPEIQAQNIAMQDKTSTVNPYHAMGMKPNNYYNPGNVVGGGYVPGS
jgi:hypothetical protein